MKRNIDMNPKLLAAILTVAVVFVAIPSFIYEECRIDVPNKHIAVLTHKTGKDLEKGAILAPSLEYKGVQKDVLKEGRYYYNPYDWSWQVVPQVEIPDGKLGVRIRMYGEDLPAGELIAGNENQKGIVAKVLNPGRYPYNAWVIDPENSSTAGNRPPRENYAEIIELHDPVTIDAGYKGLITELSAPMPKDKDANQVVSSKNQRGVQQRTLEPGTYLFESLRAGSSFGRLPQPAVQSHRHRLSHQGRLLGEPGGDHRVSRQTGRRRDNLYPL
jgi:hypothetical protein